MRDRAFNTSQTNCAFARKAKHKRSLIAAAKVRIELFKRSNEKVIRNFKDQETEKIFERTRSRKLPSEIQQVALRKLRMLNRAETLQDLRVPPANRLERLTGDREGQYSIRVNNQWRICFKWEEGNAIDVEIVDYH